MYPSWKRSFEQIMWEKKKCYRTKEERNILKIIQRMKGNLIGHMLRSNCLLKHVIEGQIDGRIKMMGRRGRKHKLLLDEIKGKKGYWKLKEETLDLILWRTRFGRICGLVVRLRIQWMDRWVIIRRKKKLVFWWCKPGHVYTIRLARG